MSKIFVVLLIFTLIILSGYGIYNLVPYINSQINNQNLFPELKKVLGSTPIPSNYPATAASLSVKTTPQVNIYSSSELAAINDYLIQNVGIRSYSGLIFCAFEILANDNNNPSLLYLWTLCQEYYQQSGKIVAGDGISIPVSLNISRSDSVIHINSFRFPRAGNNYQTDLKQIFPFQLLNDKILNPDKTMLDNLQNQVIKDSKNYYKI